MSPQLTTATAAVHRSFLEAMDEFVAEGRDGDGSMVGGSLTRWSDRWHDPEVFAAYVASVRAKALEDTPRPQGVVPSTTLWWVDGDTYLGRLTIRHRLTPWLRELGGHIGYDIRATARRRGHATAMLRAALPVAHRLRIERALVTCDYDNVASRKVIEASGGVFEDRRQDKLRYWITTGDT